jgi:hypothetical protein
MIAQTELCDNVYSDGEGSVYMCEMSNLYNISNGELSIIDYYVDFKYNKLYRKYGRRVDSYVKIGNNTMLNKVITTTYRKWRTSDLG